VNAGARGYFRSNYYPTALARMNEGLDMTFSPEERISLLVGIWAMACPKDVTETMTC
jgi:hypothetical protein